MLEPHELSQMSSFDEQALERKKRRMYLWVALVALIGIGAFGALVVYAKQRTIYAPHYEFRSAVKAGVTEKEVIAGFGRPYRSYWTPEAIGRVFAGRGIYGRFDRDVTSEGALPSDFKRVMLYRTTNEHAEFVFVGQDGKVMMVVTGRVTREL